MRKFKELEIWKLSKEITTEVYRITKNMPSEELFGLTSQMRRAAISIPSNISEGCSRSSNVEFTRFLQIAIGSSFELETQLIISKDLDFLDTESVNKISKRLGILQTKVNAFITSVKNFNK